ncbi:Imm61 family immunity protein [Glaciihabitans tibetensis]|nr:Imm61 family immunity protein [Glaciihabitans tibetensis]
MRLAEWARPIGLAPRVVSDDEVVLMDGGGELRWYVRNSSGRITVGTAQRSATERLRMATEDVLDAERYLTVTFGRSTRQVLFPKVHLLRLPWESEGVAKGFAVVPSDDGDLPAVVLELGIERARFSNILVPYEAVPFTIYANTSITDLRESMLDRFGKPALAAYVDP